MIKITSLLGKPIAGTLMDTRIRNSEGVFRYEFSEKEGPRLRVMKSVEIRHKKDGPWLYWTWEPIHRSNFVDCGYSGIRMDQAHIHEYYLAGESDA